MLKLLLINNKTNAHKNALHNNW